MKSPQPSVAQALSLAHAALLEDLRNLEEASRLSSREGLAEFVTRLVAIHANVSEHFRFEEQNGYMHDVRKREPWLERTIAELGEEHRQLLGSLETLLGEAKAACSLDDRFREKARAWVEQVRHHEARENELLQDAFNRDISAED